MAECALWGVHYFLFHAENPGAGPVRPRVEADEVTAVIDMTPANGKEKATDTPGSDER